MYVGPGGAGNYVKMVHNGIEYGDMQLIAEAYDTLKTLGGLSNDELAAVFKEWNSVSGGHGLWPPLVGAPQHASSPAGCRVAVGGLHDEHVC
jgi:hypothetical protein